MLKSFDRAFWIRHYKFPNKEIFKPATEIVKQENINNLVETVSTVKCKCPFGNPEDSRSYIFKDKTK